MFAGGTELARATIGRLGSTLRRRVLVPGGDTAPAAVPTATCRPTRLGGRLFLDAIPGLGDHALMAAVEAGRLE